MANFDLYFPVLLKHEGGYVNNPNDKGKCTNMGITLATLQGYLGGSVNCETVKNLSEQTAKSIYKKLYWDKIQADKIKSQSIAEIMFDWVVNSGISTPSKKLQQLIGADTDGIVGDQTISKINSIDSKTLFDKIKQTRIQFYKDIVANNPTQTVFLRGWLNRIESFQFKS